MTQYVQHKLKQGLAANINAAGTKAVAVQGEPHWTTDTCALYVFDGTQNIPVAGRWPGRTITASTTLLVQDFVCLADASGGAVTLTLPAAANMPQAAYIIKKIDSANIVTIAAEGGETIDGAASITLNQKYQAKTIWSNGSAWYVL